MSLDTAADWNNWKPGPLLPRQDGHDRGLAFVIAVLCFLATLMAFAALAANRAAEGWVRELSASATVQVVPKDGETDSEAATRAAEALSAVKGVTEAASLDRAASEKLLEPWLGKAGIPDDLPIPRLVTVELDPHAPATAGALNAALEKAGVNGTVDDHSRWLADVKRSAGAVGGAAVAAGLLVAAAAGAVIAFATRAGLAARHEVVEVLHLAGAQDAFVARLFQRRFAFLAARAGFYGAAAAAALSAAVQAFGGSDGFTPVLPMVWTDLLAALPIPVLAAAVAALAARGAAMRLLKAEP